MKVQSLYPLYRTLVFKHVKLFYQRQGKTCSIRKAYKFYLVGWQRYFQSSSFIQPDTSFLLVNCSHCYCQRGGSQERRKSSLQSWENGKNYLISFQITQRYQLTQGTYATTNGSTHAVTKLKEADQSSRNQHRGRCSKVNRTVVGKNRSRGSWLKKRNPFFVSRDDCYNTATELHPMLLQLVVVGMTLLNLFHSFHAHIHFDHSQPHLPTRQAILSLFNLPPAFNHCFFLPQQEESIRAANSCNMCEQMCMIELEKPGHHLSIKLLIRFFEKQRNQYILESVPREKSLEIECSSVHFLFPEVHLCSFLVLCQIKQARMKQKRQGQENDKFSTVEGKSCFKLRRG